MPAANATNQLINSLSIADRAHLTGQAERVRLGLSEILCSQDEPQPFVYFPIDGFVSVVGKSRTGECLQVAMVGREGMLGAGLALGLETAPLRAVAMSCGSAWRLPAFQFSQELLRNPRLQAVVLRYLSGYMAQLAAAAVCASHHPVGARLARWLLMAADRMGCVELPITHQALSVILGVRRVSVTTAAIALQRGGCIDYQRGKLTIMDRSTLQNEACVCYRAYDRDKAGSIFLESG